MSMPRLLPTVLICGTLFPVFGSVATAADLDYSYAPPPPRVAYERPFVEERRVLVERPVVVERPVIVRRPVLVEQPVVYPRPYFYARRFPPPFYRPYRHFAYGPRFYGHYGY